jgi:epoxide hydrolase-like predicted phosphatase
MIKAIIFDCFGVLYPDTYWTMAQEYLGDALDEKKSELSDLVRQVDLGYITRDELWAQFAVMVGETKEQVYARLREFSGLDKRLLNFIDEHRSTYKIGMISNVGQGFLESMFIERPASEYFDSIVLSSEVGLVKPDKRIYDLTAERLNIDTNMCVFIDDLSKNVTGAKNAGMQAILYTDYASFKKEIDELLQ